MFHQRFKQYLTRYEPQFKNLSVQYQYIRSIIHEYGIKINGHCLAIKSSNYKTNCISFVNVDHFCIYLIPIPTIVVKSVSKPLLRLYNSINIHGEKNPVIYLRWSITNVENLSEPIIIQIQFRKNECLDSCYGIVKR